MITIRLLGGAKKAVGRPSVELDRQQSAVSDILSYLQGVSADPRLLVPENLIVAVNGVDSAALDGPSTLVKSGDSVTVVTVVHGGSADLKGWGVLVAGVRRVQGDPGRMLDEMRAKNPDVFVQAIDAQSVYGQEHVIGALQIALEAQARKIMIADRVETELLLRLACTDQISDALKKAGLKKGRPGCIIGFSRDVQALKNFGDQLAGSFSSSDLDDSVVKASREKAQKIAKGQDRVLDYLLERAAIMVRG